MREVFVTGIGVVSALGIGIQDNWNRLKQMDSGITWDPILCAFVAKVPLANAELQKRLGLQGVPFVSRTATLGILAAQETLKNHALSQIPTAFVNGTTVGGMDISEDYFVAKRKGEPADSRVFGMHDLGGNTSFLAKNLGKFSSIRTLSTACSSGANAILMGGQLIRSGKLDRVVAGGTESFCRFTLEGFKSLMVYDGQFCRPFDANRQGLNLGEGAAYLVLESEEGMRKSGSIPLAKLSGWSNRNDAYHSTGTSPNGIGAQLAMKDALQLAGLSAQELDYINAHGTGTPTNDSSELAAMLEIFKGKIPPFSSTKGSTGHTLGASGAIEAVYSIQSLLEGFVPGNAGVKDQIPEAESLVKAGKSKTLQHVMSNSFGFGGNSTSLIFSKN